MKNNFKKLYTAIIVFFLICILSPITTYENETISDYENIIPLDDKYNDNVTLH